jgi:hypothetical protein
LQDSGQKSLTLTTKTAPEGLLRLILEKKILKTEKWIPSEIKMQNFLSEKTFQKTERVKKEVAQYFVSKPVIFFKKLSERHNIWNERGKILVHLY